MNRTAPNDVDASDGTEALARAGLVARGVVYLVLGILTVRVALGGDGGGEEASTTGAFAELADQPFGQVLLGLVALGLLCWAATCAIAAATGENGSTPGPSDTKERVIDGARAVASLVLAGGAVAVLLRGGEGSGDGEQEREMTARLMDAPAGQVLVGLVGLVLLGIGLYRVKEALDRSFLEGVDLSKVGGPGSRSALERLGLVGHLGKALVFLLLGGFVIRAAIEHDPDESRGLDSALRELAGGGFGVLLLWAIALGLVCFGVWSIVEARARRSDT